MCQRGVLYVIHGADLDDTERAVCSDERGEGGHHPAGSGGDRVACAARALPLHGDVDVDRGVDTVHS